MSSILYYSNYCDKCKLLIQSLSKSKKKEDIHYICVDKRFRAPNNTTLILLENGQKIVMPPQITRVPALLLLNNDHKVLFGEEIRQFLQPQQEAYNQVATNNQGEPQPFVIGGGSYGVSSDVYSYWDQSSDDLSAKGDGGTRQMYNYSTINHTAKIETPPEDYTPDKIGEVSLEQLEARRNKDVIPNKQNNII